MDDKTVKALDFCLTHQLEDDLDLADKLIQKHFGVEPESMTLEDDPDDETESMVVKFYSGKSVEEHMACYNALVEDWAKQASSNGLLHICFLPWIE